MEKNMKIIETQDELDALGEESHIWDTSRWPIGAVPGTGSPHFKLTNGMWWDYSNDLIVESSEIKLPAVLVWDGVA